MGTIVPAMSFLMMDSPTTKPTLNPVGLPAAARPASRIAGFLMILSRQSERFGGSVTVDAEIPRVAPVAAGAPCTTRMIMHDRTIRVGHHDVVDLTVRSSSLYPIL